MSNRSELIISVPLARPEWFLVMKLNKCPGSSGVTLGGFGCSAPRSCLLGHCEELAPAYTHTQHTYTDIHSHYTYTHTRTHWNSAARSCLAEHCDELACTGIEEHSGSKSSLCFHWRSNPCCSLALGKWALSASVMFFWGFLYTFHPFFGSHHVVLNSWCWCSFKDYQIYVEPIFQCFPPDTGDWWGWKRGREGRCQERQQQQCRNKQQQQQQHQVLNAVKVVIWILFPFWKNNFPALSSSGEKSRERRRITTWTRSWRSLTSWRHDVTRLPRTPQQHKVSQRDDLPNCRELHASWSNGESPCLSTCPTGTRTSAGPTTRRRQFSGCATPSPASSPPPPLPFSAPPSLGDFQGAIVAIAPSVIQPVIQEADRPPPASSQNAIVIFCP